MDVTNIKKIGNIQKNFMFRVWIPTIPLFGTSASGSNISFLVREANLPTYTRNYINMRFLGSQVAIPRGTEHDGEWTITANLTESGIEYKTLVNWWKQINLGSLVYNPSTNAFIEFVDLSMNTNFVFEILNIQLKNAPGIETLSQDATDGLVTIELVFTFDDIEYDVDLNKFKQLTGQI